MPIKGNGPKGMSQRQAIFQALEKLRDQTSISTLQREAELIYRSPITGSAVSLARAQWRKENEIQRDNRTYEGQPRRDMLNDHRTDLPQVKRISKFVSQNGNLNALLSLISDGGGCCHSIEQLRNAVKDYLELQMPVRRAA